MTGEADVEIEENPHLIHAENMHFRTITAAREFLGEKHNIRKSASAPTMDDSDEK